MGLHQLLNVFAFLALGFVLARFQGLPEIRIVAG